MRRVALGVLAVLLAAGAIGSVVGCGGDGKTVNLFSIPFDAANFAAGVDNPFFPLTPGTTYRYETQNRAGEEVVEVTVTPQTKQILGVTCTVVRDTVRVDGELVEDTFDWFAADQDGNVWYLGEDSKEYEGGQVVSTEGSWEAGVNGAQPGVIMFASPPVGEAYRQEFAKGVAEDMARVVSLAATVTVPYGTFSNCWQIEEWNPLESGGREYKYYARDIGLIKEEAARGGETLELVAVTTD